MSRNTMSFALPESRRDYIDGRVRSGQYGNTGEYLRDLIRRDQRGHGSVLDAAVPEQGVLCWRRSCFLGGDLEGSWEKC